MSTEETEPVYRRMTVIRTYEVDVYVYEAELMLSVGIDITDEEQVLEYLQGCDLFNDTLEDEQASWSSSVLHNVEVPR